MVKGMVKVMLAVMLRVMERVMVKVMVSVMVKVMLDVMLKVMDPTCSGAYRTSQLGFMKLASRGNRSTGGQAGLTADRFQ